MWSKLRGLLLWLLAITDILSIYREYRNKGRVQLSWRLCRAVLSLGLAGVVAIATPLQAIDFLWERGSRLVYGVEPPQTSTTIVKIERSVNVAPGSENKHILPVVYWNTIREFSSETRRIYSKKGTHYEGSLSISGATGYDYYRNMNVYFGGVDKGEIVLWREPIIGGFTNATNSSNNLEFFSNRLPDDIMICVDHGPGPIVRSVLLFRKVIEIKNESEGFISQLTTIQNVDQHYTTRAVTSSDCADDMITAAQEFGLEGSRTIGLQPVLQYQIDGAEFETMPWVQPMFTGVKGEDFKLRVSASGATPGDCLEFSMVGIRTGDSLESVEHDVPFEIGKYDHGGCPGELYRSGVVSSTSFGNNGFFEISISRGLVRRYLAFCTYTEDPTGGRTILKNNWFRVGGNKDDLVELAGPPPFRSNDSVFCRHPYKWRRPT